MQKEINLKHYVIKDVDSLKKAEDKFRDKGAVEQMPWAKENTPYTEIAETIIKDRKGAWATPLQIYISRHRTTIGARQLCRMADQFVSEQEGFDCDILSVQAGMKGRHLVLVMLLREYSGQFDFKKFFDYTGDQLVTIVEDNKPTEGNLIIPDSIKNFHYTPEQIKKHDEVEKEQKKALESATKELPFLNRIDKYEPKELPNPEDHMDLIYDLRTKDQQTKTVCSYDEFYGIFSRIMIWVTGIERYQYMLSLKSRDAENEFMSILKAHVQKKYVDERILPSEDYPAMIDKLYRALYQLYIVQDLIDDPNITDIKITAPESIRVRIKGDAYLSNVHFVDENDYIRFIDAIAVRNGIKLNVPEQTFTDTHDENYILRFSITAEYVNSVDYPYLHIRKIARHKLLGPDLIKAGMFDEKVRDYLLDCGKNSRGVVFAGPPGSGKTVALNWFLEEAYEESAEILVIQENDELFAYSPETPEYRKGVMFQHVVNYSIDGKQAVTLEQLGQLALVAGANVFVIGEAKGAEICSAITLSNSGCRTAITIHSPSSTETIDKMADLAMRGYANDYNDAKRMLKSFQTIVYLQDFKVQEISEITGYNEDTHEMEYRYIYRRDAEKKEG